MRVLVIGATGGTGAHLVDRLVAADHDVRALARQQEQLSALRSRGAQAVLGDLEGELAPAFEGVEAVCFCAGSGSATGPNKTLLVDLHGAVRTFDLCAEQGVDRYLMLSAIAADDPLRGPERLRHYLAAKHAADRLLMATGLDWTIVRPGRLTDDEPTGRVSVGVPRLAERGEIPRADVAAVMARCLEDPSTYGSAFELVTGRTPVDEVPGAL